MRSPQTLSEADRRLVAAWAADCAERVLGLFEAEAPNDHGPRDAIARTRAYSRGELGTAEEIRRRFGAGRSARDVGAAATAAARAAGQASAVAHMGAHALGAAAYAAKAAGLAAPDQPNAVQDELRWQLDHMSDDVKAALRTLPPIGENRSGPLGPGMLASGQLGTIIRALQAGIAGTELATGIASLPGVVPARSRRNPEQPARKQHDGRAGSSRRASPSARSDRRVNRGGTARRG